MNASADAAVIRWGRDGLVPVVAVDAGSGDVLMVASMNAAALARTRETGVVHYWSRSRQRLWRKGETSGHEQRLVDIRLNCNRDSLLVRVEQVGAVCHDGYPTCFYRRLDADGTIQTVRDRAFDPAEVYRHDDAAAGEASTPPVFGAVSAIERWYGAFLALREQDLTAVSGTSRLLRATEDRVSKRLADELEELAGVLDGSHGHAAYADDVALEATQCLYWSALCGIRLGMTAGAFAAAAAVGPDGDGTTGGPLPVELRAGAARVRADGADERSWKASIALVARAAARGGVTVADLIGRDTVEMQGRPYLADYFGRATAGGRLQPRSDDDR